MPIIRDSGRPLFEFIHPDELNKRLKAGTARPIPGMPIAFEGVALAPAPKMVPPPDLDSVVDEEPPPEDRQTYQTADLKPEPRRRRGRPRKPAPLPPAATDAE